jgi:hypothetical protein
MPNISGFLVTVAMAVIAADASVFFDRSKKAKYPFGFSFPRLADRVSRLAFAEGY